MADQAPQVEKAKTMEGQMDTLRTLMINVADRIALIGRTTDKEDLRFTYEKAKGEVERIKALLASGVPSPEFRNTSWPVIESEFIAVRNALTAKGIVPKTKDTEKPSQ